MIRRTLGISAGVLLLVAASVSGQDAEAKKQLPFEFKISGDTVESFKAEFKLNAKIDQSTPEALINSYCLLADGRTEVSRQFEATFKAVPEIVRKTEQPIRAKLFSEAMQKKVAEAEKSEEGGDNESGTEATEITKVSDGPEGAKLVETLQKTWYMMEAWDEETGEPTGKKEKQESKMLHRYTCSKGSDGNWRIDKVESKYVWEMEGMGEQEGEWEPAYTVVHYLMTKQVAEKPAELKQDTPENAALSLFNHLLRQRAAWNDEMRSRALRGWADALMPMFSEKGLQAPEEDDDERKAETNLFDGTGKKEVDFVSDDADGVKRVKFKASGEWFGAVEVYVKKEGEVWKIIKTGYYEVEYDMDSEGMKETEFVEEYNLDMLSWR